MATELAGGPRGPEDDVYVDKGAESKIGAGMTLNIGTEDSYFYSSLGGTGSTTVEGTTSDMNTIAVGLDHYMKKVSDPKDPISPWEVQPEEVIVGTTQSLDKDTGKSTLVTTGMITTTERLDKNTKESKGYMDPPSTLRTLTEDDVAGADEVLSGGESTGYGDMITTTGESTQVLGAGVKDTPGNMNVIIPEETANGNGNGGTAMDHSGDGVQDGDNPDDNSKIMGVTGTCVECYKAVLYGLSFHDIMCYVVLIIQKVLIAGYNF